MALVVTIPAVVVTLSRGDVRLPSHMWYGHLDQAGDVSGGNMTMSVTRTMSSRFGFSVEEASAQSAVAGTGFVQTFATFPPAFVGAAGLTITPQRVMIEAATISGVARASMASGGWMGPYLTGDLRVEVSMLNPTAGGTMVADAWGYLWSRDAFSTEGGPISPRVSGLPIALKTEYKT